MSVAGDPYIVENGLVMCLDAASQLSYPGTGNTWYDISGYQNNFTLFNSPVLSGGAFNFNGTNQYAQCINTTCGNFGSSSYTLEYAVSYTSPTPSSYNSFLMKRGAITSIGALSSNGWAHRVGNNSFFVQDDNSGVVQANIIYAPGNVTNNSPNVSYYCAVITRSGLGVTLTMYLNNNQILTQSTTFVGTGNVSNNSNMSLFYTPGESVYTLGSLYFARMYNRALTVSEINQNYYAQKSRFGLP